MFSGAAIAKPELPTHNASAQTSLVMNMITTEIDAATRYERRAGLVESAL